MVGIEQFFDEIAMALRNKLLQTLHVKATLLTTDIFLWNNEIDAKGPAARFFPDKVQRAVKLLRRHTGSAEDAEAARFAHGSNDCAAMAEGKNREIDPILITDRCAHVFSPYGSTARSSTNRAARRRWVRYEPSRGGSTRGRSSGDTFTTANKTSCKV